jgi:hypothetical protein
MATRVVISPAGLAKCDADVEKITRNLTRDIMHDAKRRCPVDTGELEGSIEDRYPGPFHGQVWVGTDHWAPTEYGSAPHIIRAHGNYSLHNRETGQYFGPVVHHPGTPEQPFMRPAAYTKRLPRL